MGRLIRWSAACSLAMVSFGVAMVSAPSWASAGETHSNCVTFDPTSGDIVSVTPNCSQTTNDPVPTASMSVADPCDSTITGTETIVTNQNVFHVTVNGAGDLWITNTQNGTASFVPDDPTGPTGHGTWTGWFGGSLNSMNSVLHSTFSFRIHLSNGQTITEHEVMHMGFTPNGPAVSFDNKSLTCGG